MIELLIFDAEGVVVDTESAWDAAHTDWLGRHGQRYDRDRFKPLLAGRREAEGIEILRQQYGLLGTGDVLARERRRCFLERIENHVAFIAGFLPFFGEVRQRYPVCVASAMTEEVLEVIDRQASLRTLFGGKIFTLAQCGCRDKGELFRFAAQRFQVAPCNCLVLEDAPLGVAGARQSGMKCIALTTTFNHAALADADHIVADFTQLTVADLEQLWTR